MWQTLWKLGAEIALKSLTNRQNQALERQIALRVVDIVQGLRVFTMVIAGLAIGTLAMAFSIAMILHGLWVLLPWTPYTLAIVQIMAGAIILGGMGILLAWVFSEKFWIKQFNLDDWIRRTRPSSIPPMGSSENSTDSAKTRGFGNSKVSSSSSPVEQRVS